MNDYWGIEVDLNLKKIIKRCMITDFFKKIDPRTMTVNFLM